jgi:hypothetical protein
MNRARLIGAVRDRMRIRTATDAEHRPPVETVAPVAPPDRPGRTPEPAYDEELEHLVAEARYARDRFDLYQARVRSGSSAATSLGRLRDLERTATAASDRLAHAQRVRRGAEE